MANLVATGIDGLDLTLGGGLPEKSLLLLIGEPGSHYDTFTEHILYNHVSRGGKVAFYLAEISRADVMEDMKTYGLDVEGYVEKDAWLFVSVLTPDLQKISELVATSSEEVSITIGPSLTPLKRDFLGRLKEKRWTALQLSHILLLFDVRDAVDLFLYVKTAVRHYGGIHFVLIPHGVHHDHTVNTLKHLSDGVFEFTMRERAREYEGVITIRKLRQTLHRTVSLPFTVSRGGIYVERAERII